jgi:hypothetical protein
MTMPLPLNAACRCVCTRPRASGYDGRRVSTTRNRVLTKCTGYTYDDFGRTLTVPSVDAGGQGVLTLGYYTNDLVQSVTGTARGVCQILCVSSCDGHELIASLMLPP